MAAPTMESVSARRDINADPTTWSQVTDAKAFVMPYFRKDKWNDLATVTLDGLACSLSNGYVDHGNQDGYSGVWYREDISALGGDKTFSADPTWGNNSGYPCTLEHADGGITLVDTGILGQVGSNLEYSINVDPDGHDCIAIITQNCNDGTPDTPAPISGPGSFTERGKHGRDTQNVKWWTMPVLASDGASDIVTKVWWNTRSVMTVSLFGVSVASGAKKHQALILG